MYSRLRLVEDDRLHRHYTLRHQRRVDKIRPKTVAVGAAIGAAVTGVTSGAITGAVAGGLGGPPGVVIGAVVGATAGGVAVGGAIGGTAGAVRCLLSKTVDRTYKKHELKWDKEELLKHVQVNQEVVETLSKKQNILEDNDSISMMIQSAEEGTWQKVFSILKSKPHIINAIPDDRPWSILHHAVWQNDCKVVKRLLACPTCDSEIKAKRDWNNKGSAGMTPFQLAVHHKEKSCKRVLQDHKKKDIRALELTLISELHGNKFVKKNLPYFDLATSFLERTALWDLYFEQDSFQHCTEVLYDFLENNWKYVRDAVTKCLYPFDKRIADRLERTTTSYEFKKEMIWIYSCSCVYRQVNAALRRASQTEFPVGDDLLLSLYSLFLTSIILHWEELERIEQTTYRGLAMSAFQAKLYTEGTTFYWLSFTSSTKVKSQAESFTETETGAKKALFIIDNSRSSLWSPRNIVPFSINGPNFLEVVHPPCAKFCVTRVNTLADYTEYSIQLLPPGGECELLNLSNEHQLPWNKESLVQQYATVMQVIAELSETQRLSEDNKDASAMVLSAKACDWEKMLAILRKKSYIINAIPLENAWSVLHQAVWQDHDVVARLLGFATCDFQIRARRDRNNYGEEGMTPFQLAVRHNKKNSQKLLTGQIERHRRALQVTFIPETEGDNFLKHNIPYFDLGETFLQRGISKMLYLRSGSFYSKTKEIYELLENDWKFVQATMRKCLYPFDKDVADHLEAATTCAELKQAMIEIYTFDRVYRNVSSILQGQAKEPKVLGWDDMLLSLYSLVLTSIVLHWKDLERTQETTYRGLTLTADQAELYHQGATFYWMPFISGSTEKPKPEDFVVTDDRASCKALFVIDNSQASLWSPLYVVPFCDDEPEFQVVYPPLAKFCVTNVREMATYTEYRIRLLDPDEAQQHTSELNQVTMARLL